MKYLIRTVPFVLSLLSWADAGPTNLALHCKYSYAPEPKYALTADSLDNRQLTDGIVDQSLWYERYREKTVGWHSDEIVEVDLDLGQQYSIGTLRIHTIGGGKAGVEYPEYIISLASVDGVHFSPVSMVDSDSLKSGMKGLSEPKVLELAFNVQCRYVKILVRPNGNLFFSDELEVFGSEKTYGASNAPFMSKAEAVDYAERIRQLQRNLSRLRIEDPSLGTGNQTLSASISNHGLRINALKNRLTTLDTLANLEKECDLIRAVVLNSHFSTPWFCTPADPMDVLRFADLPKEDSDCEFHFYQWQNEYGLAALNLTNCSQQTLEYRLSVSPIAGGVQYSDPNDLISIRRVCYVRSKNAGLFGDPLVLQGGVPFKVRPGETVQLCIEFFSNDLPAGDYTFAIAIQCNNAIDKNIQNIPVRATIAGKTFPSDVDFMTCNWDYITDKTIFTAAKAQLAAQDLKKHYLNVTVIPPGKIFGTTASKSPFTVPVSDLLKRELDLRSYARFRLFFLGLNTQDKLFGTDLYSLEWDARFRSFIQQFIRYLTSLGCDYDDYAIYPYDEYIGEKFVHVARIIREIDPRVKIFANSYRADIKEMRKAFGLVDIWCPYFEDLQHSGNLLAEIQNHCSTVWCYHTDQREDYVLENPDKMNNRYHRILPLTAKALGLKGAAFWTYCDWRGGHFDYNDKRIWGVIYDGRYAPTDCIHEPIVPSKRWQLWREGVEDAVCLAGHTELLSEFLQQPRSQLTSEYFTSLRQRADKE